MNVLFKPALATILLFFFSYCSYSQKNAACVDVHEGVFYNYPKNSADKYMDIREGDYVHESNPVTGDTSLWKIKWNSDCTYSLSLVDMNGKLEEQTRALMKKHKLVFTINNLTNDYYTYTGYLDKTSNLPLVNEDTMWMHEKVNIANNELFEQVPCNRVFKKTSISDTAKYALLYVYRPGKLALSLANYLMYFDNNIMCVAQNSSGFVFRILKEGNFELKSRLYKDESSLPLNIHFGKIYFVKTSMDWGLHRHLYNFKLQNELVDDTIGWTNFQDIKRF